jgi:hypothetical protein
MKLINYPAFYSRDHGNTLVEQHSIVCQIYCFRRARDRNVQDTLMAYTERIYCISSIETYDRRTTQFQFTDIFAISGFYKSILTLKHTRAVKLPSKTITVALTVFCL